MSHSAIVTTLPVANRIRTLVNNCIESQAKIPSLAEIAGDRMTRNKNRRPGRGTPVNQTSISRFLSPQMQTADDQRQSMNQPTSILITIVHDTIKSPSIVMTETTDDDVLQEGSIPETPDTNNTRAPSADPTFDDEHTIYTRGSYHHPVRHSNVNEMSVKLVTQSKTEIETT